MSCFYNFWVRTITLSAFLWPIVCSPLPATVDLSFSKRETTGADETLFVFRGDTRCPQLINSTGGFFPFSSLPLPATELGAYSIYNHVHGKARGTRQTIYISTTTEFCVARRFAKERYGDGYVYHIHATPNMIDVVASLQENKKMVDEKLVKEKEMIAMGVITWRQVIGWFYIKPDPPMHMHPVGLMKLLKHSSTCEVVPELNATGDYTSNPDYDATFNELTTSGPQPQLAGTNVSDGAGKLLKKHAREFMERTALPLGGANMTTLFDVDG